MEDIYTIRVKTKPDTRNLYPSERRYSASTVLGLAWVHVALAGTSFLLACLALINPNSDKTEHNGTYTLVENGTDSANTTVVDNNYILVLAPSMVTSFALLSGLASILASVRWYIDRNITWLFIMSILSTAVAFISIVLVIVWLATSENIGDTFKAPVKDFIVVKHTDVIDRNESHLIIAGKTDNEQNTSYLFTKTVLSINILIAAFLELLWSVLSVKISYKGMKNTYKDDSNARRGNCISVITKIKGNNANKFPRNGKLVPPKPDLIEHYPNKKIKRIFLAQSDNGFYLKNQNDKNKQNTDTSSECYKERMMNYLNRCASLEGISNPELPSSVQSETVLNPIPEVASVDIDLHEEPPQFGAMTPVSWGDTPEHTIYNQNNISFERLFNFGGRKIQDGATNSQDVGAKNEDGTKNENGATKNQDGDAPVVGESSENAQSSLA